MATTPTTSTVLSYIRHWINRKRTETASDETLLRRFSQEGDETAFALLMDRHGPMVLGTARRFVGDEHLAEDVFQATFLTLARQTGRLRRAAALPAWLHSIACRLALTALRQRKRRQRAEGEAVPRQTVCPAEAAVSQEQLDILDEELSRLPERFRLPLVLCCLEGHSQAEAAALLGWTLGSVKGRLERGRLRLRERLRRRGLTVAVAATIPALDRPTLAAPLCDTVLRAARPGASLSPVVSALVREACKPFSFMSWKAILIVAVLGLAGTGVGVASRFAWLTPAVPPSTADDGKPTSPRAERNPDALPSGAVARLGGSPLRIGNAAFALTTDGHAIVTVTPEGLVRRFDAMTGRLLERRQLGDRKHTDPVGQSRAHLSADGQTAVIDEPYDGGRRLTVWNVPSGKQIFQRTSTSKRHTGFGALSPDGKLLALVEDEGSSDYKKELRIVHLDSEQIRDIGRLEYNVYGVYFSADGKRLVASQISSLKGGGNSYAYFDVEAGKELWRLPRTEIVYAISPDGKTVFAPMLDQRRVRIIETDPASGKPTEREVPCNDVHPNDTIVIAPDNRTVVRDHFGEIILWDLQAGKEIRRFALPKKNDSSGWGPQLGAFSPDSRTVVTNIGHLQRWDLRTCKPFFDVPSDDGLAGPVEYIGFTPDGKELFAKSWWRTSGRWDMMTKKRISFVNHSSGHQLARTFSGLRALSVDSFRSPYEVTLIDPLDGKPLTTVRWAEPKEVTINGLRAFTLTTDGKTLLTAHGKEPDEKPQTTYVTACDVASGRRLSRFAVPGNFYFERSPFSPCGRWVVIGEKVYHVGSGTALFAPSGEADERLVAWDRWTRGSIWFSEDGRLMAGLLRKKGEESAAHDTLAVWEMATGAMLARYPKAGFIGQAAFAPDGRTLALHNGRGIRLEDLQTGKRLAEYEAPDVHCQGTDRGCTTQTLVFAPDGSTLATGHRDGTILLWKVPQSHSTNPSPLADGEVERLWTDLGSTSPSTARAAVERLVDHPDAAAEYLAKRFRPAPADPKLKALINDLDNDVFAVREEATRKLRAYGARAEGTLRRTLAQAPSVELRRRIENIMAEMSPPLLQLPLSGERLRGVRVIEVLERAGNPAARQLLLLWAEQTDNVQLAVEARMALERLQSANSRPPRAEKRQLPRQASSPFTGASRRALPTRLSTKSVPRP